MIVFSFNRYTMAGHERNINKNNIKQWKTLPYLCRTELPSGYKSNPMILNIFNSLDDLKNMIIWFRVSFGRERDRFASTMLILL